MSEAYTIRDQEGIYFVTLTIIGWVALFTRKAYRDIILDSLKSCQERKGLVLYCYCMMSSHLHDIIATSDDYKLENTLPDFKKFTSKSIIQSIKERPESGREWLSA
ncbi:MAG: putative transposase [Marivirga sp.]|jgi:putative transposase